MAELPRDLSFDELKNIVKKAFLAEPLGKLGVTGEVSPYQGMLGRSNIVDYARQILPAKVENTNWYRDSQIGEVSDLRRKVANMTSNIPLGGYDPRILEKRQAQRAGDLVNIEQTVDARKVPLLSGKEADIGDSFRARAAQATGVAASDVARDGLRNIWWFLNAPQAIAQIASLQAIHDTSLPYTQKLGQGKNLIGRGALRYAATAPAIIAMSTGIGNIGRPAGYKAILPSEEDPRKTDSPVGELLSRYFLGRTGRLLPYDEFAKERPDVDKGEYQRYKAYQFNKQTDLNPLDGDFNILGALRGTTEGIHGPEINFMGKAIPVLTGVLPTAAAVAGIKRGITKAGDRLRDRGYLTKVKNLQTKELEARARRYPIKDKADEERKEKALQQIRLKLAQQETDNSIEAAKQALLYGSGYTTAAALTGQALESIRRDMGRED
ncbi:MAG TPA: hypothetical protein DEP37_07195 [Algoriphagus sp.]|nr:hypothetical protein [Algoriphagus sp.]|tara:strand:+ start:384 stop:1697 length:1314 start_codon:yes stop_codon:yes gene_type:complete